ncbi:glycine/betaine ABC transporter permease, partial [Leptospira kmetyi]
MGFNFANPRIPLGSWIETFFDWFQNAFDWLITFTNVVIGGMYHGLNLVLSKPLYLVMMAVFAAIGWACANWRVGLFALIGFY